MGKIVNKLNLNRTPQAVENNSLVFAKNIKLNKDGSLSPDTRLEYLFEKYNIFAHIVGVNNKIYLFSQVDRYKKCTTTKPMPFLNDIDIYDSIRIYVYDQWNAQTTYNTTINLLEITENKRDNFINFANTFLTYTCKLPSEFLPDTSLRLVNTLGHPYGVEFYGTRIIDGESVTTKIGNTTAIEVGIEDKKLYTIIEYDEITKTEKELETGWKYQGGKISGCVTINNTSEPILTICETNNNSTIDVPIKHINLTKCTADDDESIYTQAPNIPITNLHFSTKYKKQIPNGTYQFYIRYKIREGFYTNWFPCSGKCFAGSKETFNTIQGTLTGVNINIDSKESFVFNVEHLFDVYKSNYEEYQLGFTITNDDATNARSWKSFDFSTTTIYFDYENVKEVNIDELINTTYELFNVGNVCYFKNKLYIADYKETDFNKDLASYAKSIDVELDTKEINTSDKLYIGDQELNKENESDTVFTKWGDSSIYDLFISENTSIIKSSSKSKKDDTSNTEYGALTIETILDTSVDPDIIWIHKSASSISGHKFPTFAHVNKETFYTTGYFTPLLLTGNGSAVVEDTKTHPFNSLPNTKKRWYFASGSKKANIPNRNGIDGPFQVFNNGFGAALEPIIETLGNNVLVDFNNIVANKKLQAVSIKYNGNVYTLWEESEDAIDNIKNHLYYGGLDLAGNSDDDIYEEALNIIKDKIVGIDANGTFYAKVHNQLIPFDQFEINYCDAEIDIDITDNNSDTLYLSKIRYEGTKVNHLITVNARVNSDKIKGNTDEYEFTTLSPFTDYEFYIHYVQSNGIVTNGYFICKKGLHSINPNSSLFVIFPRIKKVNVPEGYSAYFISICHVGDKILKGFNYSKIGDYNYIDCLESDAMLDSLNDNIEIIDSSGQTITKEAKYHASSSTEPISMLGNAGCIRWLAEESNTKLYKGFDDYFSANGTSETLMSNVYIYIATDKTEEYFKIDVADKFIEDDFLPIFNDITSKYPTITLSVTIDPTTRTRAKIDYALGTTNVKAIGFAYGYAVADVKTNAKNNAIELEELTDEEINKSNNYWIKIFNKQVNHTDKVLTKITPYIKADRTNYFNRKRMYLTSYICKVYKLDRDTCNTFYYAGSDIYVKNPDITPGSDIENLLKIEDYENYKSTVFTSPIYLISHYNLNYVNLTEDLTPTIASYKSLDETIRVKQIIYGVQSATCSAIYELKSMYKDWVNKGYSPAKLNTNTSIFKNTIRSSSINSDDAYKSIYTFDAEDYYNVPTNRGIIVSMFSILDNIYIHTEHSLFKFSGKNSLSSEDSEVTLKEGDVFDTGISEIFDSKYGYAGLADKRHSIVTFNSYIFYDKLANTIYGYSGNNNLVAISDTIKKLIENITISDIFFTADEFNDRFYMNIVTEEEESICLSYNTKVNGFISIHDFDFRDGFNSRLYTYFVESNEDKSTMYKIDKTGFNDYKTLFKPSKLSISDMSETEVENCIDIVCNENYETIKELNFINWICSAIGDYGFDNLLTAETINYEYAGSKIRIYTDQTYSDLIDLVDENGNPLRSNDNRRMDATTALYPTEGSYKYPTYNKGIWNYNYFRDIKNVVDIFHYNAEQRSDNHSILYGKYFVVRFIFNNKNFKFENITFNYNTI
ncbi:MAG: hypothetical protein MJ209_00170 [archaeon]|nr:hypothetical protein [archaeon]